MHTNTHRFTHRDQPHPPTPTHTHPATHTHACTQSQAATTTSSHHHHQHHHHEGRSSSFSSSSSLANTHMKASTLCRLLLAWPSSLFPLFLFFKRFEIKKTFLHAAAESFLVICQLFIALEIYLCAFVFFGYDGDDDV